MVVSALEDGEAPALVPQGHCAHEPTDLPIIVRREQTAPIAFVEVESGRDTDDVRLTALHLLPNLMHIGLTGIGRDIVNDDPVILPEDVHRSVAVVVVDVEDIGRLDFTLPLEEMDGDGHIAEEAETPGGACRGVVSGGTDEPETGLRETECRCLDSPAGGQGGDRVEALCAHLLDMAAGMHSGDILGARRYRGHEFHVRLDHLHDGLHAPGLSRGIIGVHLIEVLVKHDLHTVILIRQATSPEKSDDGARDKSFMIGGWGQKRFDKITDARFFRGEVLCGAKGQPNRYWSTTSWMRT